MGVTKQLPRAEWMAYFERYTRTHLEGGGDRHEVAYVEVLSPSLGDQVEAALVPLLGMTYDPKSNMFELALEDVDHLVFRPTAIAVIEEDDGFVSAVEIVRSDDVKEIVQLRRSGLPAVLDETPSPPHG